MHPEAMLAPAGILEVDTDQLNIIFGTSRDTSDFVADCLELWWTNRQSVHLSVRRLSIDLDNGPEIASSRTQFMKRLVEFSDRHQLTLELAYYPPYHSKYNLIERCWGILENHWNGTLLTSIQTALEWAKSMTWRGVAPIVHLMDRVYETASASCPETSAQSPRACNDRRPSPNGASSSILKLGRLFPAGCLKDQVDQVGSDGSSILRGRDPRRRAGMHVVKQILVGLDHVGGQAAALRDRA